LEKNIRRGSFLGEGLLFLLFEVVAFELRLEFFDAASSIDKGRFTCVERV
jgi:hypothetical protein